MIKPQKRNDLHCLLSPVKIDPPVSEASRGVYVKLTPT